MSLPYRQSIIYWLEGLLVRLLLGLFGMMSLDRASGLGGFIARLVGPRLGITKRARRNLSRALPDLGRAAQDRALLKMWDNLGRVAGEFAHLPRLEFFTPDSPVEIIGLEHLDAAKASGRPIILFSGHLGNWEILSPAAIKHGLPMTLFYRSPNNPGVEQRLAELRRSVGAEPVPKTRPGARRAVAALREGRVLGLLVDQKMREGIAVPFFGRPAMTATVVADLALRYRALLIPTRIQRLEGARFRITIEPPRDAAAESSGTDTAVYDLLAWINSRLEAWIRDDPGQWFWLHRRWPES